MALFLAFATFTGNGTVANVLAVETAFPINLVCQLVSLLLSRIDTGAHGGGAKHTATGRYHLTVLECSARVEDFAFQCGGCIQAVDGHALA